MTTLRDGETRDRGYQASGRLRMTTVSTCINTRGMAVLLLPVSVVRASVRVGQHQGQRSGASASFPPFPIVFFAIPLTKCRLVESDKGAPLKADPWSVNARETSVVGGCPRTGYRTRAHTFAEM